MIGNIRNRSESSTNYDIDHVNVHSPIVEFVSVVVGGYNVQQQDVFGFGVQAGHTKFHLREHLPATVEINTQIIRQYSNRHIYIIR